MAQSLTPFQKAGRPGWHIFWRETYADGTTRQRQKSGFPTRKAAREFAKTIEEKLDSGTSNFDPLLTDLIDRYLAGHTGTPWTIKMLRWKLDKVAAAFGHQRVSELSAEAIRAWRTTIPQGHRTETTQALKQTLRWAFEDKLIAENPASNVKNPQPTRRAVLPFETWIDVEAVAHELGGIYSTLAIFAAGTGLRPGEWVALERRDLMLTGKTPTVNVSRRMTKDGNIVDGTKDGKLRRVPLRPKVVEALRALPPRLDTKLVFPNSQGKHTDLHNWRQRYWRPALLAAGYVTDEGKPDRGPYALRHTYAAWVLASGTSTFALARRMGTSLEMIEETYGHLTHDADEAEIERMAAFDAKSAGLLLDAPDPS